MDVRWRDALAVKSLLLLPLEVFTKTTRERILRHWLPVESTSGMARGQGIDAVSAILSLLVKTMKRPTSYEVATSPYFASRLTYHNQGMRFADLVNLAGILSHLPSLEMDAALSIFKELVRLTLM